MSEYFSMIFSHYTFPKLINRIRKLYEDIIYIKKVIAKIMGIAFFEPACINSQCIPITNIQIVNVSLKPIYK